MAILNRENYLFLSRLGELVESGHSLTEIALLTGFKDPESIRERLHELGYKYDRKTKKWKKDLTKK